MIVLQILIVLLGVYLIFSFLPSVVMFRSVFCHRMKAKTDKDYYVPFFPLMEAAEHTLRAIPVTEVSVTADDGITLRGDYYDRGSDRTAICFHGYRGTPMCNCGYQAALLADAGYNVLLVHQRAHGRSEGTFCAMGVTEQSDVLRWVAFAAAMPTVEHVVLYGVSMGAASIAYASDRLGAEHKVRAMVLDCGFLGVYDQLRDDCRRLHLPPWAILPVMRLCFRLRFGRDIRVRTTASLEKTTVPALFLHGKADESVSFSHGEAVFAACASEKEAYFHPTAAHTCTLPASGEEAARVFLSFLDEHIHTI